VHVTFWGVRGSIPTPGEDTRRWGGNSSCIEVRHGEHPPLVLDCGTGARKLGISLMGRSHRALDLVFTHLHMDHVFGLPFFVPLYAPGFDVRITVPAFSADEAREKLARYLNGVYHPTRIGDLPANVSFHPVRPGRPFQAGAFELTGISLNHPGGAIGYKVTVEGKTFAYITDTAPFAKPGEGVAAGQPPPKSEQRIIDFLRGADLVVYDTMYDLEEYLERMTWGHSYPEYAAALCRAAEVDRLVLFHHLPDASDASLDDLEQRWSEHERPTVLVAKEGVTLDV